MYMCMSVYNVAFQVMPNISSVAACIKNKYILYVILYGNSYPVICLVMSVYIKLIYNYVVKKGIFGHLTG